MERNFFTEQYSSKLIDKNVHIAQLEAINLIAALLTLTLDNELSQKVLQSGALRDRVTV